MPIKPKKSKQCKQCDKVFQLFNSLQKVCSPKCAAEYGKEVERKKTEKINRKAARELKTNKLSFRIAQAQIWFNKFIRLRDKNQACISCDRIDSDIKNRVGGKWDAGHYKTRGAFPELRFEELNAHKQCKSCNGGAGKYSKKDSTVSKEYRERLIKKIGLDKVEWLEGPHEPKNYTVDQVREIERTYKRKCKELESNEF